MNKLQQFLSLPKNEHPRGNRVTRSTFWYELFLACMIGVAWGIVAAIFSIAHPFGSILSLLTYIAYLYFGSRNFRNNVWDQENA